MTENHTVFGVQEQAEYLDRKGAYLIPLRGDEVGVIETPKGFFLLGGGMEEGETETECILRECMEEAGAAAELGERVCSAESFSLHPTIGYFHPIQVYYSGKLEGPARKSQEKDHILRWMPYEAIRDSLFLEMQNWALEQVWARETEHRP